MRAACGRPLIVSPGCFSLEIEPERELENPRCAHGEGRAAEVRAVDIADRDTEVRVVEDVEGVGLQRQATVLRQPELLVHPEVHVPEAGTGEGVAAERAVAPPLRGAHDRAVARATGPAHRGGAQRGVNNAHEGIGDPSVHAYELCRIEEAIGRAPVPIDAVSARAEEDRAVAREAVRVGVLASVVHGEGNARLDLDDAGHHPAPEPAVVFPQLGLVAEAGHEAVRDVEVSAATVEPDVEGVLRPEVSVPRIGDESVAQLVDRLREGVVAVELEAVPRTPSCPPW